MTGACSHLVPGRDSMARLDKPTVVQHLRERESSLPCSQQPATGPIISQRHPIHTSPSYFSDMYSNITLLPFIGHPTVVFPSGFTTKPPHPSESC
jgi:hypothetical protein